MMHVTNERKGETPLLMRVMEQYANELLNQ